MSDATQTTTETQKPKTPFDPDNPDMTTPRRCRALKVDGIQCRQSAMKGFDYCIAHFERSPRKLAKPGHIIVPLLEDHSAVRLMCTKIMSSALNHELDPIDGRLALAAAKIAVFALPRLPRMKESDKPEPVQEAVHNFSMDEEGNWIGPREAYRGPNNTFEPEWSAAKYMFEQHCIRYGTPLPESAADFPDCGWLTEEEMKMDPREWTVRQNRRLDAVLAEAKKIEAARAKARDEKKQQADKEAGIEPTPAPKPLRHGEALGYYDPVPESAPEKKPAASAPAPVEPATQQHATTTAQPARQLTASDLRRMADNQSKAAAKEPTSDTTTKEPPPFPIPGVPMTCPDEENGVCWCGGPDQQFPCEPCRLKRDANNLDLKAVAEPKLRVSKTRLPHPFSSRCSTRKGGIPQLPPCRLSETCTLPPVPCSPVVDAVNTARNHIPCRIQTVTRKKVTVSRFGAHPKNRPLNSVALEQNQQTEGGPTIP
jgi:hypothetical protein